MLRIMKNLLANHLSRELKELFLSSAIIHFATSAIAIFEPIYFLRVGLSIGDIFLFYGALYFLYFLLLPLGGRLAKMHGYEHVMLWSSPFSIIYYLSLFAIPYHPFFIFAALTSLVISKSLYWPGYHADFARYGRSDERGREIGGLVALLSLAAILGPVFGGLVISVSSFQVLFVIVAVLILLSNIPLLTTPEKFTPTSFSYKNAMKEIFRKENWRQTGAFIGYSEDTIAMIIWPIFISFIIKDLFSLGAIISGSIILNALIMLVVGNLVDRRSRISIERLGTVMTALVWFGRTIVNSSFGVFLSDNFYRISRSILGISLMSIVYDEAKKTSVMSTMIFREMGLALGKFLGAIVAILVWIRFPDRLDYLFILAGILSLFYLLLKERIKKDGMIIPLIGPDLTVPIQSIK